MYGSELPGAIVEELDVKPDELVHSVCRIRTADGLKVAHDLIPSFELTGLDLAPDLIGYFFIFRNFMRHIQ